MPKPRVAPATTDVASRPKNKLLACLPPDVFEQLRPHLRTIPISVKQVLHPNGEEIREVFFLNGGVASVTTVMRDGSMVEIATIGREGVVGVAAYFGQTLMVGETMIQVPDTSAEAMPLAVFLRELDRRGPFFECVRLYAQGFTLLMMQSTACVALHSVQERCCRWLLATHDRVDGDEFTLSHEFLAMMLGATRPTVSVVAANLQKTGLIKYTHGRITVLDRPGLEAATCECYATVREHFDRLGL